MHFLHGITWLLVFQLIGEVLAILLKWPIPGPVIGMMLLFALLVWRGRSAESLDTVSSGLLGHLSLLFVPAGVGMMLYFPRIVNEWLPISLTLVVATLVTMMTTAWVMQLALNRRERKSTAREPSDD